jgi:hypothetical protein
MARPKKAVLLHVQTEGGALRAPDHVLAEREHRRALALEHEPTPNEVVLGDPPPWRAASSTPSALSRLKV